MKKQFVSDLHPGEYVDSLFYVAEKEIRKTREGKDFITLQLRDKTGSIKAIYFDPGSAKSTPKGSFVRVTGQVSEYKGSVNIRVDDIWQESDDEIDYRDFLPSTDQDVQACFDKLHAAARSVREPLAALLTAFFDNASFSRNFKLAPGGVRAHHGYLGGLCVHTHDMLDITEDMCKRDEKIDRDLLVAGVLLHDIGKTREYQYTKNIDNTDEGKLLGHIVIGVRMIEREITRIPDFPERLAWKVLHMVVSHHGTLEYGSPRRPLFIEAEILHHIDDLDAKRAMYVETAEKHSDNERWSEYHPYLSHDVYLDPS